MANVIVQGVFVVEPGARFNFIEASVDGMLSLGGRKQAASSTSSPLTRWTRPGSYYPKSVGSRWIFSSST